MSDEEHFYVSGDHWAAILDSIADIKESLGQESLLDDTFSEVKKPHSTRSPLLYGTLQSSSKEEILSNLPPKATLDRLIALYFNRLDLISCKSLPLQPKYSSFH